MRVGLQVPRFTWPGAPGSIGPGLARIARTADEAGFASIWVMDHFFQIEVVGDAEEPMLEGYSALGRDGVDDIVGTCRDLAGAGIQHAIFNMPNVHDIEPLETFGREIIPAVADF